MKIGSWDIRHGDRVTIRDRFGALRTGKAVGLLLFPTHATINMGGRYGTPAVADPDNIVKVNGSCVPGLEYRLNKRRDRNADKIDGYDRNDLGESPDY